MSTPAPFVITPDDVERVAIDRDGSSWRIESVRKLNASIRLMNPNKRAFLCVALNGDWDGELHLISWADHTQEDANNG